jgi:hypothetical protein
METRVFALLWLCPGGDHMTFAKALLYALR